MSLSTPTTVTPSATLTLGGDGILRVLCAPLREHTLAHAQENARVKREIQGGRLCPLLIDNRQVKVFTREARVFYSSPESNRENTAVALLVTSPVDRVVGNFFIATAGGNVRSKLFTSEVEAIAWLKGFVP